MPYLKTQDQYEDQEKMLSLKRLIHNAILDKVAGFFIFILHKDFVFSDSSTYTGNSTYNIAFAVILSNIIFPISDCNSKSSGTSNSPCIYYLRKQKMAKFKMLSFCQKLISRYQISSCKCSICQSI